MHSTTVQYVYNILSDYLLVPEASEVSDDDNDNTSELLAINIEYLVHSDLEALA